MAPEPEGSSPHLQEPTNDPYPEPGESTPHPSNQISVVLGIKMKYYQKVRHQSPSCWMQRFRWSAQAGMGDKEFYEISDFWFIFLMKVFQDFPVSCY
jgi:hypothetical protein